MAQEHHCAAPPTSAPVKVFSQTVGLTLLKERWQRRQCHKWQVGHLNTSTFVGRGQREALPLHLDVVFGGEHEVAELVDEVDVVGQVVVLLLLQRFSSL